VYSVYVRHAEPVEASRVEQKVSTLATKRARCFDKLSMTTVIFSKPYPC
jgi:hypothetical protein